VPVKEYTGSKRDLSLYSLTKYLKSFKEVKDVRVKIAEDFSIN
jgi:NADPH-dependent 7-cyano-7-deazaguanine reductase QueF